MAIDFKKQELLNLYYCYRESYEELLSKIEPQIVGVEYGSGGEVLHRGYHCPSPVLDIVIGGANRGRLIKRPRKNYIYNYSYFKDSSGKIIMIDNYDALCVEAPEKILCRREFLIYHDDEVTAPIYDVIRGRISIASISNCKYDKEGKIEAYRIMHASTSREENGELYTNEKGCQIYAETYSYDSEGLLERSILADQFKQFTTEYSYRYYHDPEGYLSYYEVENITNGNRFYDVPKSQRRKV